MIKDVVKFLFALVLGGFFGLCLWWSPAPHWVALFLGAVFIFLIYTFKLS